MRAQEYGQAGDQYHELYSGSRRINAVPEGEPLAPYEMLCGLLVPLYTARAAEEVFYGRGAVTLSTAKEVRAVRSLHGPAFILTSFTPDHISAQSCLRLQVYR